MTPYLAFFAYLFAASAPLGYRLLIKHFTPGFDEYEAIFVYLNDAALIFFLVFYLCFFWLERPAVLFMRQLSERFRLGSAKARERRLCLAAGAKQHPVPAEQNRGTFSVISKTEAYIAIAFLAFCAISTAFADYKLLALYDFLRLALLMLAAFALGKLVGIGVVKFKNIFIILSSLAVIESLIGFLQFIAQQSLGLKVLGESVLGLSVAGSAKVVVDGTPLLRAYGTFPHPNVLAAFLLLGLASLYYLWLQAPRLTSQNWGGRTLRNTFLGIGIFAICTGLALSFSRAGWILASAISVLTIGYYLYQKSYRARAATLLVVVVASCMFLLATLSNLVFPRAAINISEPAVSYRLAYNEIGLNLIKNHPLGVGLGNQVVYSVDNEVYQKFGMNQVWQWQPIHNIYLLIASEAGVLGLIAFILFVASVVFKISNFPAYAKASVGRQFSIFKLIRRAHHPELSEGQTPNSEFFISTIMLSALLGFGLVDHFLWTLEPGRLMLWLTIGLVMGADFADNKADKQSL